MKALQYNKKLFREFNMAVNKRMYGFVLAINLIFSLSSIDYVQDVKPLLVTFTGKVTRVVERVKKDVLFSPVPYAGIFGLGAAVAFKSKEYPVFLPMIIAGISLYHGSVFGNWWKLGVEYNQLRQTSTEGDLLERNAWGDDTKKCTGYNLWDYFIGLSGSERKRFARTIQEQVNNQSIKSALYQIQRRLDEYEKFSNILYVLARTANFYADPKELLTSDYLLKHDIDKEDSLFRKTLKQYTGGSFIARSFALRYKWSVWLGTPVPTYYNWCYQKASLCIWELIHQYARLKAVAKILEIVPTGDLAPLQVEAKLERNKKIESYM